MVDIGYLVRIGSGPTWLGFANSLLTTCTLCVLATVVALPKLPQKFLLTPDSRVLVIGTLVLALEALYLSMRHALGYPFSALWDSLGFAALLFSYGYVALRMVPAALIASMIKVGLQSVVPCAQDPGEVLGGRILSGQLRDNFVTAAYLWVDTENRKARYAAAGPPPLVRCRDGKVERIESNGLVFGVLPHPDYPVYDMSTRAGDRFSLYTDGVIEAENVNGKAFGDQKFQQVVLRNQARAPSELVNDLLSEIRACQPA